MTLRLWSHRPPICLYCAGKEGASVPGSRQVGPAGSQVSAEGSTVGVKGGGGRRGGQDACDAAETEAAEGRSDAGGWHQRCCRAGDPRRHTQHLGKSSG